MGIVGRTVALAGRAARSRIAKQLLCEAGEELIEQGVYVLVVEGIFYVGQSKNVPKRIAQLAKFLQKGVCSRR